MVFRRQLRLFNPSLFLAYAMLLVAAPVVKAAECNINEGPCIKTAAGRAISFDIMPRPVKAMEELVFSVMVTPCTALPETLLLDLDMPGMMMGKNQVVLKKINGSIYRGKGIIVRCRSGRTLWRATILSDALNNTAFTFDVKY
jgi:hypothetical protein